MATHDEIKTAYESYVAEQEAFETKGVRMRCKQLISYVCIDFFIFNTFIFYEIPHPYTMKSR